MRPWDEEKRETVPNTFGFFFLERSLLAVGFHYVPSHSRHSLSAQPDSMSDDGVDVVG